jgi:hypothetical protein
MPSRGNYCKKVSAYRRHTKPSHKGAPGGCNRLPSARGVAGMFGIPERTVRDKWRDWRLPACRIGNICAGKNVTARLDRPPDRLNST